MGLRSAPMSEELDLSRVFELERHGTETYLGESPDYSWGRIYGGLVIAQALWAATQTVKPEYRVHSLHAYFILGGTLGEPVRYEVDRVRNGRSFVTRRVVARQSTGAILTLGCSFQLTEVGPETQTATFPSEIDGPEALKPHFDAGCERCDVEIPAAPPRSLAWARYPASLGDDPRLHACMLAYLSDINAMSAVHRAFPGDDEDFMGASLDHAMWFHRPVRADNWVMLGMTGHGIVGNWGPATGILFQQD